MKKTLICLSLVGIAALPTLSQAQDLIPHHFGAGVGAGIFIPESREIRDIFGSSIFKFGFHLGLAKEKEDRGFKADFGYISATNNGNNLHLFQFLGGYQLPLGAYGSLEPYVKVAVGLAYEDYNINSTRGYFSTKRVSETGQIEIGAEITDRIKIKASYNVFQGTDGFNFNGYLFEVNYDIVRF